MKRVRLILALAAGMLIGSSVTAVAATTDTVQGTLAKLKIYVDGKQRSLQNSPIVVKGTTYLPVREVAELTGYDVQYNHDLKFIHLTKSAPPTFSVGGNIERDDFTMEIKNISYTPEYGDYIAGDGRMFAVLNFDLLVKKSSKYESEWIPSNFVSSFVLDDGSELKSFFSTKFVYTNKPDNADVVIAIPEGAKVKSVKITDPFSEEQWVAEVKIQ